MRLRIVTDSMMETYAPIKHSGAIGATVHKIAGPQDTFSIEFSGGCEPNLPCPDLVGASRDLFYGILAHVEVPPEQQEQPAKPLAASMANELERLAQLRKSGVLTAKEFEQAKARIISGR